MGLAVAVAQGPTPQDFIPSTLRGLDVVMRVPVDNRFSPAKVALGRRLFFDPALSLDGRVSCATCHDPAVAFADRRPLAVGVHGRIGERNSPSLVNRGYGETFFWDGRVASLEAQVLMPIENPKELGMTVPAVLKTLRQDRTYPAQFRAAFGREMSGPDLGRALATYVRTIQAGDAPADRYSEGDRSALSPEAQLGARVFRTEGLCVTCHMGGNFSDEQFHNTGVAWTGHEVKDVGREKVTGALVHRGAFKTPSLREVARTAPYMHDGSLATLEEVVDFYIRGGRPNPHLDSEILPLQLSSAQRAGLIAFLQSLTGTVIEGRASSLQHQPMARGRLHATSAEQEREVLISRPEREQVVLKGTARLRGLARDVRRD